MRKPPVGPAAATKIPNAVRIRNFCLLRLFQGRNCLGRPKKLKSAGFREHGAVVIRGEHIGHDVVRVEVHQLVALVDDEVVLRISAADDGVDRQLAPGVVGGGIELQVHKGRLPRVVVVLAEIGRKRAVHKAGHALLVGQAVIVEVKAAAIGLFARGWGLVQQVGQRGVVPADLERGVHEQRAPARDLDGDVVAVPAHDELRAVFLGHTAVIPAGVHRHLGAGAAQQQADGVHAQLVAVHAVDRQDRLIVIVREAGAVDMAAGHGDHRHGEGLQRRGQEAGDGRGIGEIGHVDALLSVHHGRAAELFHFRAAEMEAGGLLFLKEVIHAVESGIGGAGNLAAHVGSAADFIDVLKAVLQLRHDGVLGLEAQRQHHAAAGDGDILALVHIRDHRAVGVDGLEGVLQQEPGALRAQAHGVVHDDVLVVAGGNGLGHVDDGGAAALRVEVGGALKARDARAGDNDIRIFNSGGPVQHVEDAVDIFAADAGDVLREDRLRAGSHKDRVGRELFQRADVGLRIEPDVHAQLGELILVPVDDPAHVALQRRRGGVIHQPAQPAGLLEQGHLHAALRGGEGGGQSGGAAADDRHLVVGYIILEIAVAALLAHGGVHGAVAGHADGHVLFQRLKAVQAADAAADILRAALHGLDAPAGIRQPGAAQRHEVLNAVFEELFRIIRLLHRVDGDDGDADMVFDGFDDGGAPALGVGHRLDDGNAGLVDSAGDVDGGRAGLFHGHGDGHAVLRMDIVLGDADLVEKFIGGDAQGDGVILAAGLMDALHDLGGEPAAVFKAAAVLVGAVVGIGGEELADEIAVGGMELHAVEAGLLRADGGIDEVLHKALDLGSLKGAGGLLGKVAHPVGGADHGLAAGEDGIGLAAGMVELAEHPGVVPVHGGGHFCHAPDIPVAGQGKLAQHGRSVDFVYTADLGVDQPAPAGGSGLIEVDHVVRGSSVKVCDIGAHRAHHKVIFCLDLSNFAGCEQFFVHFASLLMKKFEAFSVSI